MQYVSNFFGGGDFGWIQNAAEGLIRQICAAAAAAADAAGASVAAAVVNVVAGVMMIRIRIGHALIIEMGKTTADDGATARIEAQGSVRGAAAKTSSGT